MIMKKTVLLIILIIGYYLPSFTQSLDLKRSNQLELGKNYGNFSLKNRFNTFSLGDSIEINGLFIDPLKKEKFGYSKLFEKNKNNNGNTIDIFKQTPPNYNMPVHKPEGKFLMPIHKPDSTISYTLRIKED